jgi:hypothetical protein
MNSCCLIYLVLKIPRTATVVTTMVTAVDVHLGGTPVCSRQDSLSQLAYPLAQAAPDLLLLLASRHEGLSGCFLHGLSWMVALLAVLWPTGECMAPYRSSLRRPSSDCAYTPAAEPTGRETGRFLQSNRHAQKWRSPQGLHAAVLTSPPSMGLHPPSNACQPRTQEPSQVQGGIDELNFEVQLRWMM